jgi:NAD-dependent deacetylase
MAEPRAIERAGALVRHARRIVACTGAGISTDSGIPDYRGPSGLWTKDPAAARFVDLTSYLADPTLRAQSWQRRANHPAMQAEPNVAHRALAGLFAGGTLRAVLTQNIDGLHQRAGLPGDAVLEMHGNIRSTECVNCAARRPMAEALARVRAGETDPKCQTCGGILKSATVFFGQPLDPAVVDRAGRLLTDADLIWVIGSSLRVQPVAGLVAAAARQAPLIIVNAEPTPYDELAAAVVREPIGTAIPALARPDAA